MVLTIDGSGSATAFKNGGGGKRSSFYRVRFKKTDGQKGDINKVADRIAAFSQSIAVLAVNCIIIVLKTKYFNCLAFEVRNVKIKQVPGNVVMG